MLTRRIYSLAVVVGPLAMVVAHIANPSVWSTTPETILAATQNNLNTAFVTLLGGVVASVVMPIAVLGWMSVIIGQRRLASAGLLVGLTGWAMTPVLIVVNAAAYELAASSAPNRVQIYTAVTANPTVKFLLGIFFVGHVAGTLMLGLALTRGRNTPSWPGFALCAGVLGHAAAHFVGTADPRLGQLLACTGFLAMTGGGVWLARRISTHPAAAPSHPDATMRPALRLS